MMLADLGAEVLRIDRKNPVKHYSGQKWDSYNPGRFGVLNRGKQSVTVDLKTAAGIDCFLQVTTMWRIMRTEGLNALITGD